MTQPLSVLIVEDSADDVDLLQLTLRRSGYHVLSETVDTPKAMRAALERQTWDLITSDHGMPNFSAPTALAIAKELRPDVPFIIVSGDIDLNLAVSLIKKGAQDYVQKGQLIRLGPIIERELRDAKLNHERKLAEEKRHEGQALFQAIVENVGDLVAVLDPEGRRIYNSPSYSPLFLDKYIRRGTNSFMEIHAEDRERIKKVFRRTVETGVGERAEFRFTLKDGTIRHMQSDGRAISGADGKVSKVVVVSRDITELKHLEAALRALAATDILTGLPNRRHFVEQMEQELARLHRDQGRHTSVLMLDADHFKRINDTFGHAAGDDVLRHLAALMKNKLRKVDTVGSVGGEGFALILPGAALPAAEAFAERLRINLAAKPVAQADRVIPVTVSIGVAEMDAGDASANDAMMRADRALYRAKESGRNMVAVEA